MKCSNCGKVLSDDCNFCSECGTKIDPSDELENDAFLSDQSAMVNGAERDYLNSKNEVNNQAIKKTPLKGTIATVEQNEASATLSKKVDETDSLANKEVEMMENENTPNPQEWLNVPLNKGYLSKDQEDKRLENSSTIAMQQKNEGIMNPAQKKSQITDQIAPKNKEMPPITGHDSRNKAEKLATDLMSMGDYILTMIICALPIAGLVMIIIWGFTSKDVGPNKQNFVRALLIIKVILMILNILFIIAASFSILSSMPFMPSRSMSMF